MKIQRSPGASIQISFKTHAYPFRFVIANERLDWNVFDISCWFLKKIKQINHCYLFCYRKDYKKVIDVINNDKYLQDCLEVFSKISVPATELGGSIYCYYKIGDVLLTLPHTEWWNFQNLQNNLEEIKKWGGDFFPDKRLL
jgi:hypothetical protein